jgi:hypothetical protein
MLLFRTPTPDEKRKARIRWLEQKAEVAFDNAADASLKSQEHAAIAEYHAGMRDMYLALAAELRSQQ